MSQPGTSKARALEICLQGIQSGLGPEQVLEAFPRLADHLRPLIVTALAARSHATMIKVPELPQENSLAGFLQISQRILPRPEKPWLARLVRSFIYILFLTLLILSSAWTAETISRPALPCSLLYPLKVTGEQIRLTLTKDAFQSLALELASDQERLSETHTLIQHSLTCKVTLVGILSEMEGAQWLVEDIPIQIPVNARFVGDIESGYAITIQGDLQADGSILAHSLRMREYILTGTIQSISTDQLMVANVPIQLTTQTLVTGIPIPGNQTQVTLRRSSDGQLSARLIEMLP